MRARFASLCIAGLISLLWLSTATAQTSVPPGASAKTAEPGSLATPQMTPKGTTAGAPLRIGATISDTGNLAEFGTRVRRGLLMWQAGINERGGLLGRAVQLELHDDASSAKTAIAHYKAMRASGINLFVSPYSTALTLAVRDALGNDDFAMVSIASAPQIWDRPNPRIFGAYTPATQNMDPFLELVAARGLSRVALVWQDTEFPAAVAQGVRSRAAELNLDLVGDFSYPASTRDFGQIIKALKVSQPDAIAVGSYLQDAIDFTNAARSGELKTKLLAFSGGPALREYGDTVGTDVANGVISSVQWLRSVRMPGSFDFGFRYRAEFGEYPSYDAAGGYAAGQILEAAMRLAKGPAPEQVRKHLGTMKFRSILGHYRVNANGMQLAKRNYLVQWQDSHISLVYPKALARWQVLYPLPW